jgi:hypothetical protein
MVASVSESNSNRNVPDFGTADADMKRREISTDSRSLCNDSTIWITTSPSPSKRVAVSSFPKIGRPPSALGELDPAVRSPVTAPVSYQATVFRSGDSLPTVATAQSERSGFVCTTCASRRSTTGPSMRRKASDGAARCRGLPATSSRTSSSMTGSGVSDAICVTE